MLGCRISLSKSPRGLVFLSCRTFPLPRRRTRISRRRRTREVDLDPAVHPRHLLLHGRLRLGLGRRRQCDCGALCSPPLRHRQPCLRLLCFILGVPIELRVVDLFFFRFDKTTPLALLSGALLRGLARRGTFRLRLVALLVDMADVYWHPGLQEHVDPRLRVCVVAVSDGLQMRDGETGLLSDSLAECRQDL